MACQLNDKKKALLDYKNDILKDIKYFENRIEEARSQKANLSFFDDDDDSDSDNLFSLDMGPSVTDLKLEQGRLQTCLHATQELTNLYILQSEVNVIVNDVVFEREPPVTEKGTWREVTADCRVDLVPFSITFFAHQPSRLFGPTSYRGLRVSPVKAAHEHELANSILPRVDTPSDAVEVLRSYAVAHRSRRTTLARLAEKYSNFLFMEAMANGGYVIKCANLLEVNWTLENKWSPVAPFHHRMKFDLEYMDEMYVKIISQAHRELSDPTLETDERTRLMCKIITTCLEAQHPAQELYESLESDIDSDNLRKSRLDEEIVEPANKKKKDREIMAPPKSLPKKTKPKAKENSSNVKKDHKTVKRPSKDDGADEAKKVKLSQDNLIKKSNVNTNNKVDREVTVAKNLTDNKTSDVRANNDIATNLDKEVTKNAAKIKKSNKDNVVRNNNAKTKDADKENIVIPNKGSDNKAGNIKINVGSNKMDNVQNTGINTEDGSDNLRTVRESFASKENVDKQNQRRKSINENNFANTENSNKLSNIKKTNKISDNATDQNTAKDLNKISNNKNSKLNKVAKNTEETSPRVSKISSSKIQNVLCSKNKEKPRKIKVSSSQTHKDDNFNTFATVSHKQSNPKNKLTNNAKEKVTKIVDDLNTDNNIYKKSVNTAKSTEKSKTTDPIASTLKKIDTDNNTTVIKNVNDSYEKHLKITLSEKYMQSTLTSVKSSIKEHMKKDNLSKNSNKQVSEKENTKRIPKENPANSALNHKKVTSYLDREKVVNKRDSALKEMKNDGTHIKLVEKNINATSKNTGNENFNIPILEENNTDNFNKMAIKNIANVNKNLPTNFTEKKCVENNENTIRNLEKQKNMTIKLSLNMNDAKSKLLESNLNVKNKASNVIKNIINSKNLRQNKSPILKNKINLLNPRNKISVNKLKMTKNKQSEHDIRNDKFDKNNKLTKIPQKLMSVREKIVKKNPLRISPRKIHSSLNTNSQNSSRNSQRSLQKPMTGIPRLLKKAIR